MNDKKTSVVDIHKVKGKRPEYDVYGGRAVRNTEFIENSIWANPYPVKKYGRETSLEMYYLLMRERLNDKRTGKEWRRAIENLRGKKIGCWCVTSDKIYPLICHVQIIMKLLEEMKNGIIK